MTTQAGLFLLTIALGFVSGFAFDIFRILRRIFNHPNFLIQIEDFIYWILVSAFVFYFILNSDGEMRLYLIVGAFLGMILYFFTLSLVIMKVAVTVIEFMKKVFLMVFKIIMYPVNLILKVLLFPIKLLAKQTSKLKKPARKVLQKSGSYAKMKYRKTKKDLRIIFKKV